MGFSYETDKEVSLQAKNTVADKIATNMALKYHLELGEKRFFIVLKIDGLKLDSNFSHFIFSN
jgi:hypothetical protein